MAALVGLQPPQMQLPSPCSARMMGGTTVRYLSILENEEKDAPIGSGEESGGIGPSTAGGADEGALTKEEATITIAETNHSLGVSSVIFVG